MIRSFKCRETEKLFGGRFSPKLPQAIQRAASRKLAMVDAAAGLADLRLPPANGLEVLHGDRTGQHSIRINDQWRICFSWRDGNAYDVEIVDYH
jgi:proteic killer suppression protein